MKIADAKDITIIHGLPPKAQKGDRVSIDSEFFGQEKERLHRPHGKFAFLGCSFDGQTVYYITDTDEIQDFYERLENAVHIYHNAKYDIRQLGVYANLPPRKLLWDTMLVEQIRFSGYYTDFSLADLVRRYLNTYLPKDVRSEFSDTADQEMSHQQITYSCLDVAYTWKVYKQQREQIDDVDLSIWADIELPFMWTLLSMNGIRLDVKKWTTLAQSNEKIAQEIQSKYGHIDIEPAIGRKKEKEIFVGVNLNSPKQVKEYLASLGYKADSTNAEYLEEISEECEFARDLLVYRTYSKRTSTYGINYLENYVENDGKIYADLFQMGAETGRSSCRAPNLQNQPHDPAYRECYIADDGYCLIVADWGSQEPRIAAYLSGDEGLADALNSDEKLYVRVARDVLGISITKKDAEYTHMKSTVLGIFYGMSPKGLAAAIGVSEDTAQEYIDTFLETYPGVKGYMDRQRSSGAFVTSIYGRKIWLNKYSFQWERNSLNAPIQGSAADAMKIAASRFNREKKPGWSLVLLVHDEIAIHVPTYDCEDAQKMLERIMIEVAEEMHDGIKGSVEIFSGDNWACKQ